MRGLGDSDFGDEGGLVYIDLNLTTKGGGGGSVRPKIELCSVLCPRLIAITPHWGGAGDPTPSSGIVSAWV